MTFSSQSYSSAVASLKADDDVSPQMLIDFLRPYQQRFAEVSSDRYLTQYKQVQTASLKTSRQIVLPAGQVLDGARLSLLEEVLDHEQSLANRFATLIASDVKADAVTEEMRALRRCAVREMLY